ncbi:cytochrome b-c1 complex subunit 10 [Astyanax mexicanus]|uniref:Cytochrome b-c1 complex subunit 10 n=1 Tax=Astyanax mexicanus TaxID=7994 RepID=A0A8T2MCU5_ASTMX|nr:cytochrome b-c1 complex subunit 10 [Astyanax mexicanus]
MIKLSFLFVNPVFIYLPSRVPTLAVWGGVGGVALVHFTDWRLILDYVPYINGKFKRND